MYFIALDEHQRLGTLDGYRKSYVFLQNLSILRFRLAQCRGDEDFPLCLVQVGVSLRLDLTAYLENSYGCACIGRGGENVKVWQ